MMTGVLIVGSLADVGVRFGLYGFGELLGSDGLIEAGDNAWIRMPAAIALVLLMTWICVLGHRRLRPAAEPPDPGAGRVAAGVRRRRDLPRRGRRQPARRGHAGAQLAQPLRRRRGRAELRACCSACSPTGGGSRRSTSARRPPTATGRPVARPCCRRSSCWSPTCPWRSRSSPSPAPSGSATTPARRSSSSTTSPPRCSAAGTGSCCSRSRPRPSRPRRRRSCPPPAPACRWRDVAPSRRGSATSTAATGRRTSAPGRSPPSPSPGTSACTRSARTRCSTR